MPYVSVSIWLSVLWFLEEGVMKQTEREMWYSHYDLASFSGFTVWGPGLSFCRKPLEVSL